MKRLKTGVVIGALTLLFGTDLPGAAAVPKAGMHEETFVHGNLTRKYLLHIPPSYRGVKAMPLVLVLHGQKGNGLRIFRKGDWARKADKEGFLVVAPDATGDSPAWNSGYNNGRDYPVDDLAFLRALLDDLEKRLKIDPKRIYACGLSSGAMMSYVLGAELSDRIAAIGPVAGSIGARLKDRGGAVVQIPPPKQPVSVIAIHGKADTNVPYEGSQNRVMNFLPVAVSIAFWVKYDGCNPTPVKKVSGDGNVIREVYSNGKQGTEVVLYTVNDGEHAWPRTGQQTSKFLDATDLIWDFFEHHPRK